MKAILIAMALLWAAPAAAVTYVQANFSGAINGGDANVQPPFAGNGFTPGAAFSGNLVYANELIPATGTVNIFFDQFPDLGDFPAADVFSLDFGPLSFTLADNIGSLTRPGIQYRNGQFNGLIFITDFFFQNAWYQFRMNGPTITVRAMDGIPNTFNPHGFPIGSSLINARVRVGAGSLTDEQAYPPVVPEPATWLTLILGFAFTGAALRRRRQVPTPA